MIPRFFSIERAGPGTLSTMPRPSGGDALTAELEAMMSIGVGALVSLLAPDEAERVGLADEADRATSVGLEWLHLPVVDFGIPDDDASDAVEWIRARLDAGSHVVVHCMGGIGRSSMLAAAVLTEEGLRPGEAFAAIEDARGRSVPDTDAQRRWVEERSGVG